MHAHVRVHIYTHNHVVCVVLISNFTSTQYCTCTLGVASPPPVSLAPLSEYRSSSEVTQVVGGAPPDHTHHTFGVPTIRSDLPAPRIKRVGDDKVEYCVHVQVCKVRVGDW